VRSGMIAVVRLNLSIDDWHGFLRGRTLEHVQPDCAGRKHSISLFDRMIHTVRATSTSFGRRTFR
jgi:hypothetical protein